MMRGFGRRSARPRALPYRPQNTGARGGARVPREEVRVSNRRARRLARGWRGNAGRYRPRDGAPRLAQPGASRARVRARPPGVVPRGARARARVLSRVARGVSVGARVARAIRGGVRGDEGPRRRRRGDDVSGWIGAFVGKRGRFDAFVAFAPAPRARAARRLFAFFFGDADGRPPPANEGARGAPRSEGLAEEVQ